MICKRYVVKIWACWVANVWFIFATDALCTDRKRERYLMCNAILLVHGYVCVYTHVYYVHMHVYIMHVYVHDTQYMPTHILYAILYTLTHTHTHTHTHRYMCVCVRVHIYLHKHVHLCIHMHILSICLQIKRQTVAHLLP